jgi:hypothetical protein
MISIPTATMNVDRGNPILTIKEIWKLLGAQGAEAGALKRSSLALYQTTRNADNLEAHIFCLEHLKESACI